MLDVFLMFGFFCRIKLLRAVGRQDLRWSVKDIMSPWITSRESGWGEKREQIRKGGPWRQQIQPHIASHSTSYPTLSWLCSWACLAVGIVRNPFSPLSHLSFWWEISKANLNVPLPSPKGFPFLRSCKVFSKMRVLGSLARSHCGLLFYLTLNSLLSLGPQRQGHMWDFFHSLQSTYHSLCT